MNTSYSIKNTNLKTQKDDVITELKKIFQKNIEELSDEEELSEEDQALKEGLELAVTRLQESDVGLHKPALDHLINEIRTSTSSMTAVPKPLKFLRPFYDTLKSVYEQWSRTHDLKKHLADVLSVLAMTMASKVKG